MSLATISPADDIAPTTMRPITNDEAADMLDWYDAEWGDGPAVDADLTNEEIAYVIDQFFEGGVTMFLAMRNIEEYMTLHGY